MKKIILSIVLCFSLFADAQTTRGIIGEVNWLNNWTNFKSKSTVYKESSSLLVGVISQNTTLYKKDVYLLTGNVYVTNGATLSIEPGTLIKGDYKTCGTLIVTKGAKILALGDATDPIIFTSNKPQSERRAGDWGGIILFGESITNKFTGRLDFNLEPYFNTYGGKNEQSDSGILNYVRIEFAGKKGKDFKELNGLSLAGVGSKTIVQNIQISYSNGASFKCYGGTVSLDNLVSFRALGDDYSFAEGAQSKINNSVAVRNPYVSNTEKPRCFQIESYDIASNADVTKKMTNVIAKNITLLNEENDNTGLTREAIFVRENSFLTISNSMVSGFSQCVLLEGKIKASPENFEKVKLQMVQLNNCNGYIESENRENNESVKEWYQSDKAMIEYSQANNVDVFMESDLKKSPDFRMKQNQILTTRLANN
ncbi:hypothetical protein [Flavobacterium sp.]|uniref:hypothetical protein n=1 Tax=Flavobacterium sp. TaxID=239 RepID=UPI00261602A9|nr:hypothetical protein [Flavobacterium sp.]